MDLQGGKMKESTRLHLIKDLFQDIKINCETSERVSDEVNEGSITDVIALALITEKEVKEIIEHCKQLNEGTL